MTSKDLASRTVAEAPQKRGRLFPKYAALFLAVVILALVPNAVLDVWFSYQQQRDLLFRIQHEQAKSAAEKIGQFIKEIEGQLSWTLQLPAAANQKTNGIWTPCGCCGRRRR